MPSNVIDQLNTIDELIEEEHTRLLYQQAPISNATVFAVAILFYFLLSPQIDTGIVEIWVLALFTTACFRLVLWLARKKINGSIQTNSGYGLI